MGYNLIYNMIKKQIIFILIIVIGILLFFGLTDPEKVPIGLLIIPILAFFSIFLLASQILLIIFKPNITKNRQKNLSVLIAMILSLLILFYSAGGIVVGDLILIVLIFIIGLLYVNKY